VPLGIQNIFIFNQGANQRHFLHAMPSVVTATICDAILIGAAVLGISVVVLEMPWLKTVIFVIGCCFLLYMGWVTWHSKPIIGQAGKKPMSAQHQIFFSASVSLLNPHALIDTIGVIGTSSLQFFGYEKWVFVGACVFISACWFFGLSLAGHYLHRMDKTGLWLRMINKFSALIMWSLAGYLGFSAIK